MATDSWSAVDRLNASFYSRYPYPWRRVRLSEAIGADAGPADLDLLRLRLTTPLYPYLLVR